MSCFPTSIRSSWDNCIEAVYREKGKFKKNLDYFNQGIGMGMGVVAYGAHKVLSGIGGLATATAQNVALFVKNNWKQLLAYILAWGIIVVSSGLMYGFQSVAIPISIGIGGGAGVGVVSAVLIYKAGDRVGKWAFWNWINHFIGRLDTNGTRQIVLAVGTTLILAAAVHYPYVIGAFFGIIIGNQVAMKVLTRQNLGRDEKKIDATRKAFQDKLKSYEGKINEIEKEMKKSIEALKKKASKKNNEELNREITALENYVEKTISQIRIEHWGLEWDEGDLPPKST